MKHFTFAILAAAQLVFAKEAPVIPDTEVLWNQAKARLSARLESGNPSLLERLTSRKEETPLQRALLTIEKRLRTASPNRDAILRAKEVFYLHFLEVAASLEDARDPLREALLRKLSPDTPSEGARDLASANVEARERAALEARSLADLLLLNILPALLDRSKVNIERLASQNLAGLDYNAADHLIEIYAFTKDPTLNYHDVDILLLLTNQMIPKNLKYEVFQAVVKRTREQTLANLSEKLLADKSLFPASR